MSVPRGKTTFGSLLREHRRAAGLTQEALAERSGVSPRTIQDVEADSVWPRRATALSLAQALRLANGDRDVFLMAAAPRPRRRVHGAPADGPDPRHAPTAFPQPLPPPTPTNVPWPLSSLLGREADLAAIHDLIAVDRRRLVTLTGLGGAGKTRLAVQVAADLLDAFPDGVWFVELAPASDPTLVARMVAGALGVREAEDAPILEVVVGFLQRKRLLLVLDNCEHLIDACAELAHHLLSTCPDLSILATSREPLQIDGERRWQVRPLAVPALDGVPSFDTVAGASAVQLFAERAQAIDAEFVLTEANALAVAQICTRLDGIPLAIELAASRIGVLSAKQIAARLDDSFRVLAGGTRSGPPRQQTMEAALTWSYDLLAAPEQAAFRALSTFASGFDIEAAEASISAPDTLDLLRSLVDKSLVTAEQARHGRRYRLLEPVRQYAALALTRGGESARVQARHAAHYAALAERAEPFLRGPEQIDWLDRLEEERENLRAALAWTVAHGTVDAALRLAVALTPYWEVRGYLSEGRGWLEAALTASRRTPGASRALQMRALMGAGLLAQWQADLGAAEAFLDAALAAARALGDQRHEAEGLIWLASAYWQKPALVEGLRLCEASLSLGHALADDGVIAFGMLNLGVGLRFARETARAVTVLDECLHRYRALGDVRYVAIASAMFGWAMLESGQHDRAQVILREALRDLRLVGDQRFIRSSLRALAQIAHIQGEPRRAVQLFSAGEALRTALGMRHTHREVENSQRFLATLRAQLAPSEFDDAHALGEAMSVDQMLAEIDARP